MYVYMCMYMYIYMSIYVCVCRYVCMHVCMYVYMHVYIYVCVSKFSLAFPILKYFIRKNNIIIIMQYNTVGKYLGNLSLSF